MEMIGSMELIGIQKKDPLPHLKNPKKKIGWSPCRGKNEKI